MKPTFAIGWAALQIEDKRPDPRRLLTDRSFKWIKAQEHNTLDGLNKFRERQEARRRAAQGEPAANVTPLPNKKDAA